MTENRNLSEKSSRVTEDVNTLRAHRDELTVEYKMVTARHRRQSNKLSLLDRIIHLSADPRDFDSLCDGYMDIAMDSCDAESGALYIYDGESHELYFATARGPKAAEVLALDVTIKPGSGLVGACFEASEALAISDVTRDPRFSKEVSEAVGYEVRSILTTPIIKDGQTIGAIQVINKNGGDVFSPDDTEWFRQLGRYAGYSFGLFLEFQYVEQTLAQLKPSSKSPESH
jgi:GAF domain-containing protein